eukprot:6243616-Amphidinium_carterae.1
MVSTNGSIPLFVRKLLLCPRRYWNAVFLLLTRDFMWKLQKAHARSLSKCCLELLAFALARCIWLSCWDHPASPSDATLKQDGESYSTT